MPLKIQIFVWLVRRNRVLTKTNLVKRGIEIDTKCMFCDEVETTDHLFVQCPFIKTFWQWIALYNNFYFHGQTFQDFWLIDAQVPLKDKYVIEIKRGAVLWIIWLERNKLCFTDKLKRSFRAIGLHIISIAQFLCKQKGKG